MDCYYVDPQSGLTTCVNFFFITYKFHQLNFGSSSENETQNTINYSNYQPQTIGCHKLNTAENKGEKYHLNCAAPTIEVLVNDILSPNKKTSTDCEDTQSPLIPSYIRAPAQTYRQTDRQRHKHTQTLLNDLAYLLFWGRRRQIQAERRWTWQRQYFWYRHVTVTMPTVSPRGRISATIHITIIMSTGHGTHYSLALRRQFALSTFHW